ncbi:MAG TPA: divergent PAP2 family protein [Candidatus Nanoarchaeia archaeon]|nr:divergent PAP2 family protein [Candidatus Nanoarchaeia archaeon]
MNTIITAIVLAGFGAQTIKIILYWFHHKKLSWHDVVVTGGMPSSHAAFVVALATILYLQEGTSSTFAVSLVLAFIVIRDALGVRRSVGQGGKEIQRLLRLHKLKSRFHYSLGHKPEEVVVGALIGIAAALSVYLFF